MALGLAGRIRRMERSLDREVKVLLYPEAGGLALKRQRSRVERLMTQLDALREHERADRLQRAHRVALAPREPTPPPQRAPAPPSPHPMWTPKGLAPTGEFALSAPAPRAVYQRDDELEFDVVWTPHRDALSLIGAYERKGVR